MKRIIVGILFLTVASTLFGQKRIGVEVNKNVEFVNLCFWLIYVGELYDNNQVFVDWDEQYFQITAYEKFKKYKDDPLLNSFKKADENEGYPTCIFLFYQLEDFPRCKLKEDIDKQLLLKNDKNISNIEAELFTKELINDLNSFYKKINFESYWDANKANYHKAIKEVEKNLPDKGFILTMESFYQQENFKGYKIIPSLMIPSRFGFGPTIDSIACNFLGSSNGVDKNLSSFGFDDKGELLERTIHEYGHSFANHVVDALIDSAYLIETALLFEPIRKSMTSQAYHVWDSCLKEHFVRAGEIIITKNLGDEESANELKERYIAERDFVYLPIIVKYLNFYNDNRDKLHYIDAVKYALEELKEYK